MKKRKTELEKLTDDNPNGRIVKVLTVSDEMIIILFRDEFISDADGIMETERYLWLGSHGYRYVGGTMSDAHAFEVAEKIGKMGGHVIPIRNTDSPDKPGFCIDSALVTGDIGPIWSSASVDIKQWEGVSIHAGAREDDNSRAPLPWQKNKRNYSVPTAFDDLAMMKDWAGESRKTNDRGRVVAFNAVRKRKRELAGLVGQEIAVRMELANGQEYYKFEWDSVDNSGDLSTPGLSLSLTAGADYATSDYQAPPDEDDLLALWDAMLASLKPRPGAR